MGVTRAAFVGEALTWIDTPYQHQGRLRGVACDCIGLVIGTARGVGLHVPEIPAYGKRPDGTLRAGLDANLVPVPLAKARGGDVVLFAWQSVPVHVGILTDADHVLHAYLPNRRVVLQRLDDKTWRYLVAAYTVPGIV